MNAEEIIDSIHKKLPIQRLSLKSKIFGTVAFIAFLTFFGTQTLVVLGIIFPSYTAFMTVYIGMFVFAPAFFISIRDLLSLQGKQEKTILNEMLKKNTYLEHAAKILRHDMHSGINTYIPRGIRSIERRLDEKTIERLKLESPLRLLKEGLAHTQQVYKGVYEFTDLVRQDSKLEILPVNIKNSLESYLKRTSYKDQVIISEMPEIYINEALFCTAIDNLIRNGLKYNDSDTKWVKIYMKDSNTIAVVDNGRGMSKDQFKKMIQPYARIKDQKESGSGLGLNICVAILGEHGFKVSSKKLEKGTEIAIDISNGVKF